MGQGYNKVLREDRSELNKDLIRSFEFVKNNISYLELYKKIRRRAQFTPKSGGVKKEMEKRIVSELNSAEIIDDTSFTGVLYSFFLHYGLEEKKAVKEAERLTEEVADIILGNRVKDDIEDIVTDFRQVNPNLAEKIKEECMEIYRKSSKERKEVREKILSS